jgi:hypothetical protein
MVPLPDLLLTRTRFMRLFAACSTPSVSARLMPDCDELPVSCPAASERKSHPVGFITN